MLYDKKWDEPWRGLLLRAADFMERVGHAKHATRCETGEVCLRGALLVCDETNPPMHPCWDDLAQAVHKRASEAVARQLGIYVPSRGFRHPNEVDWNNAPERTKEEVVEAMRSAAMADALLPTE